MNEEEKRQEAISQPGPVPEGTEAPVPSIEEPQYPRDPRQAQPERVQPVQPPVFQPQGPVQPPFPPQTGYYPPQPGPAYVQAPGALYGMPFYYPPKKKLPTGLKVFIWIASVLAAAAILGFGAFVAYSAVNAASGGGNPNFPFSEYLPRGDEESPFPFPEIPGRGEDDTPKFDDGVVPPDDEEDDSNRPQVDVTPNTEGITIEKQPQGQPLSAKEVYGRVIKSTVTVSASLERNGQEGTSTGTGIIATSDGYIITNAHVVLNSKNASVKITTNDGTEYDAVVVGVDRTTDVGILKTNDFNFTPAEFGDAEELSIGDQVVAIGNPGGAKFSGSMTGGLISGLHREVGKYSENGMTYIQTDAAINPGNSGGPLVNMYGQVVGINSSKIITEGYEGMGFAIPVSEAKDIIDQLLSGGYVKGRVRLGITGSDVTAAMAAIYGAPQGFLIAQINEDSAFTGTEAQEGDIITGIDGETVQNLSEISNLLLKYAPGDTITVTLYHPAGSVGDSQRTYDVTITLLEDKGETQE